MHELPRSRGPGGLGTGSRRETDYLRPGHCGHPESHVADARVCALSTERQGSSGHGGLLEYPASGAGNREVEERGACGRTACPATCRQHHWMRSVPRCHDEHAATRRCRDERGLRVVQETGLQPRDRHARTVEAARWGRAVQRRAVACGWAISRRNDCRNRSCRKSGPG